MMNVNEALNFLNAPRNVFDVIYTAECLDRNSTDAKVRLDRTEAMLTLTKWTLAASKDLTREIVVIGDNIEECSQAIKEEANLARQIEEILGKRFAGAVTQDDARTIAELAEAKGETRVVRKKNDCYDKQIQAYWKKKEALGIVESVINRLMGYAVADKAGNVTTKDGCVRIDRQGR